MDGHHGCPLRTGPRSCDACPVKGVPYCDFYKVPLVGYLSALALVLTLVAVAFVSLHLYFPAHR